MIGALRKSSNIGSSLRVGDLLRSMHDTPDRAERQDFVDGFTGSV